MGDITVCDISAPRPSQRPGDRPQPLRDHGRGGRDGGQRGPGGTAGVGAAHQVHQDPHHLHLQRPQLHEDAHAGQLLLRPALPATAAGADQGEAGCGNSGLRCFHFFIFLFTLNLLLWSVRVHACVPVCVRACVCVSFINYTSRILCAL